MQLSGTPFVLAQVGYVSIHPINKGLLYLLLGLFPSSPIVIEGNIAIFRKRIFTKPLGNGGAAGGGNVVVEYDSAFEGGRWTWMCGGCWLGRSLLLLS